MASCRNQVLFQMCRGRRSDLSSVPLQQLHFPSCIPLSSASTRWRGGSGIAAARGADLHRQLAVHLFFRLCRRSRPSVCRLACSTGAHHGLHPVHALRQSAQETSPSRLAVPVTRGYMIFCPSRRHPFFHLIICHLPSLSPPESAVSGDTAKISGRSVFDRPPPR